MGVLSGLEPNKVFEYFELLSSVPHGSGNTKAISDVCVEFAKAHNYKYIQDDVNNVVIYAPATRGYEHAEKVILQGHLDMVCAKTPENEIDMAKEPITLLIEDDFVKAKDTSLGGDNGIAVAMIMAVLDSKTIEHPAIEAVFTVDEEVGLDGAVALEGSLLSGKYLINIDSEEEGVFTCGCAGGARVNGKLRVNRTLVNLVPEKNPASEDNSKVNSGNSEQDELDTVIPYHELYQVEIGGLLGGHSGCDIEKGRANSNHLLGRMLFDISKSIELELVEFAGGQFDNVICANTKAIIAVNETDAEQFEKEVNSYDLIYKNEYAGSDSGVYAACKKLTERATLGENVVDLFADTEGNGAWVARTVYPDTSQKIFGLLTVLPQGVREMSADIKGLVQTSLNLGITKLEKNSFNFSYSVRSSVATQKKELIDTVEEITRMYGGKISVHGEYPGWAFNRNSKLREICAECFEKIYGKKPVITATHGGLECGLFTEKIPGVDCISIGPDLFDVHSVRERLSISSTERTWKLLVGILQSIK